MRRVDWSIDALNELIGIVAYIARDNRVAANKVADTIEQTVLGLASRPTGRAGRVGGTYEKVVSGLPYIIAYALGDEPKGHESVTILRVIHGARDWPEEGWPE